MFFMKAPLVEPLLKTVVQAVVEMPLHYLYKRALSIIVFQRNQVF